MKLPNQEELINSLINNCINEYNEIINIEKEFNNNKQSQILNTLEKINSFITENKTNPNPKILETKFIKNSLDLFNKIINDKEFTDVNEKLFNNILSLFKRIQIGKGFSNPEKFFYFENYLRLLIESIKYKSHYRNYFINSLKEISDNLFNKETYDKYLIKLINNEFIDSIFSSIENYYEDQIVNREVNNTLCAICINSEELGKYIVEKGGLAKILDELKFIIKKDDLSSEIIKFSSLRFIDTLVKDNSTMDNFLELKGGELILKIINSHFDKDDNQNDNDDRENLNLNINLSNSKNKKEKITIDEYLTNTTINLTKDKQIDCLDENIFKFNQQKSENFNEDNISSRIFSISKGSNLNLLKKTSFLGNITGLTNNFSNEINLNDNLNKETKNIFSKLISSKKKRKNESPQYLVYCIKIIDTNIKQGKRDFNDPKLFRNIIKLIK
jgi:hypothetical protein